MNHLDESFEWNEDGWHPDWGIWGVSCVNTAERGIVNSQKPSGFHWLLRTSDVLCALCTDKPSSCDPISATQMPRSLSPKISLSHSCWMPPKCLSYFNIYKETDTLDLSFLFTFIHMHTLKKTLASMFHYYLMSMDIFSCHNKYRHTTHTYFWPADLG